MGCKSSGHGREAGRVRTQEYITNLDQVRLKSAVDVSLEKLNKENHYQAST